MAVIDIKRDRADKVIFDPEELQMGKSPDFVFWRNFDRKELHWITAKDKRQNIWFKAPLARFVDGQPPDTTTQLTLTEFDDIDYVCSLHPGEQGKITFKSPTS